ncbi:MAG: hypothetical protein ACF8AM_20325 [Rhodopirellula sp. JB055]|uniref:glycoside hydrolase family 16 protein n=1 Tax=Rhodopirellula sp. JB055 TaxID=3342846 RepID=UPI00370A1592
MTTTIPRQTFVAILISSMMATSLPARSDDPLPPLGSTHPSDDSYKLVWHDEFVGDKLDRSKWTPEDDTLAGQYGHGNGEAQVYVDAEGETFFVKDGNLTIVASHAPAHEYPLRDVSTGRFLKNVDHLPFRSAKLTTKQLASFTYGIIEARIKNPTDVTGTITAIPTWPAFWLLPEPKQAPYSGYWDQEAANSKRAHGLNSWPYSGELDVMEMSGRATRLYHAGAVYHTSRVNWSVGNIGWYSHYRRIDGAIDPKQWIADQQLDGSLQPRSGESSYPNDFHVYGCKWTEEKVIFMLDGKEWGPGLSLTDPAKFGDRNMYNDYPFYLILNQAIGGNYFGVWGPDDPGPDKTGKNELYDTSLFPQFMQVDWVRVYQP